MTSPFDLQTGLWLDIQLRRLSAQGAFYTVIQKGDQDSGFVLVNHRVFGAQPALYEWRSGFDGLYAWYNVDFSRKTQENVEEKEIDAYIARAIARDPDLWVVEIETRTPDFPLEGRKAQHDT